MSVNLSLERLDFEHWLELKGLKPESIKHYIFYFKKFHGSPIGQEDIDEFIRRYNNPVCRAFIVNLLKYIARNPKKFLLTSDQLLELKDIEIEKITGRREFKIKKVLNEEQVLSMERYLKKDREKIMLNLTYYCGLRRGELIKIRCKDFNWADYVKNKDTGELTVTGKGAKERVVFVPKHLMRRIGLWINSKIDVATFDKNPYLFHSVYDVTKPMYPRTWNRILENASLKALGERVHPHLLRHSYATTLLKKKVDIKSIQESLGHTDLSTTQFYLHLDREKIKKDIGNAFSREPTENEAL